MSRDGSITFAWGDGEYRFRLGLGEIRELQEKTDCGPAFLLNRIITGTWRVDDLRETIRLGLIGGGTAPTEALKLVKRYVDDRPWLESMTPAKAILAIAVIGAPDGEKPGKHKAAKAVRQANLSQEASSPLPLSTEAEPSSASRQETLTI